MDNGRKWCDADGVCCEHTDRCAKPTQHIDMPCRRFSTVRIQNARVLDCKQLFVGNHLDDDRTGCGLAKASTKMRSLLDSVPYCLWKGASSIESLVGVVARISHLVATELQASFEFAGSAA